MTLFYPERVSSNQSGFLYQLLLRDHIKRYEFASKFVKNMKVLDIACGDGYGSLSLSKTAINVVGVDISSQAIELCRRRIRHKKVNFYQANATSLLNFSSGSFDSVVSFETIEHLSLLDAKKFLAEIKRVLKSSGKLFISTPDSRNASLGKKPANPYHVQEYSLNEFEELISSYFEIKKIYGQDFVDKRQIDFIKSFTHGLLIKPIQISWRLYQKFYNSAGNISEVENENKIAWVNIIYANKL